MPKISIPVEFDGNMLDEIVLTESIQTIVKNITLENLQLLARKSSKPRMNERIQKFKNLI